MSSRQPWLYSAPVDAAFILAPAFLVTLAVVLWPGFFAQASTGPWMWLLLVVGVDVAHVYSTLWRTYFSPEASSRYRTLLIAIPLVCWLAGVLLYTAGSAIFWRILAYVAVFHFVRQQYGFLRLYARRDSLPGWKRKLDGAAIYASTAYPLFYWHTHPRDFHWFVKGDFVSLPGSGLIETGVAVLYGAILAGYVVSEAALRRWNVPKNLILAGTALSWYTGIVYFNGDLAFTVTNVVTHGVPYMALIWIHQRKRVMVAQAEPERRYVARWFRPSMIPIFLGVLLVFAYVEEGFWDALIWGDHRQFYGWLAFLPKVSDHAVQSVLVPLLALPQATHYVLDGFIWKVRDISIQT